MPLKSPCQFSLPFQLNEPVNWLIKRGLGRRLTVSCNVVRLIEDDCNPLFCCHSRGPVRVKLVWWTAFLLLALNSKLSNVATLVRMLALSSLNEPFHWLSGLPAVNAPLSDGIFNTLFFKDKWGICAVRWKFWVGLSVRRLRLSACRELFSDDHVHVPLPSADSLFSFSAIDASQSKLGMFHPVSEALNTPLPCHWMGWFERRRLPLILKGRPSAPLLRMFR